MPRSKEGRGFTSAFAVATHGFLNLIAPEPWQPRAEVMQPSASVREHLMDRTICDKCGHLHRVVMARPRKKCDCCWEDVTGKKVEDYWTKGEDEEEGNE